MYYAISDLLIKNDRTQSFIFIIFIFFCKLLFNGRSAKLSTQTNKNEQNGGCYSI